VVPLLSFHVIPVIVVPVRVTIGLPTAVSCIVPPGKMEYIVVPTCKVPPASGATRSHCPDAVPLHGEVVHVQVAPLLNEPVNTNPDPVTLKVPPAPNRELTVPVGPPVRFINGVPDMYAPVVRVTLPRQPAGTQLLIMVLNTADWSAIRGVKPLIWVSREPLKVRALVLEVAENVPSLLPKVALSAKASRGVQVASTASERIRNSFMCSLPKRTPIARKSFIRAFGDSASGLRQFHHHLGAKVISGKLLTNPLAVR
jgi:hypothetical protein